MTNIILFSDLHLEVAPMEPLPSYGQGNVVVLAGDICELTNLEILRTLLRNVYCPVVYVPGNHEFYGGSLHQGLRTAFEFFTKEMSNVHFLYNQSVLLEGINFFGGTMWTDFHNSEQAVITAELMMPDYRHINGLKADNIYQEHSDFVKSYQKWVTAEDPTDCLPPRVVVTHHAPIKSPKSKHKNSLLEPCFVSSDGIRLMRYGKPDYWLHGHTHENVDLTVYGTRVITNQRGYKHDGVTDFKETGFII